MLHIKTKTNSKRYMMKYGQLNNISIDSVDTNVGCTRSDSAASRHLAHANNKFIPKKTTSNAVNVPFHVWSLRERALRFPAPANAYETNASLFVITMAKENAPC
jgi:hypothetical protein